MDTQIKNVGSQRCPRFVIGPGIPGLGQMRIVGFGSFPSPIAQQKIDAHFEVVQKEGYRALADGEYKIWEREVTCGSSENLPVIGFPNCEKGEWKVMSTKRDYDEMPCPLPPN